MIRALLYVKYILYFYAYLELVLLKEDNLPSLKWKMGRVIAVHRSPDGIIRVADVRTSPVSFADRSVKSAHYLPILRQKNLVERETFNARGYVHTKRLYNLYEQYYYFIFYTPYEYIVAIPVFPL